MSPAHVLEPTFQRLKRKLMEGAWAPGEKLEALQLADEFGVSMTPVRDCLNRLVGELLVEMKPGEGYRVAQVSEQRLRDMLEVNEVLLTHAIRVAHARWPPAEASSPPADHADRVADLFDAIAAGTGNLALAQTVRSLSERMHTIRNLDIHVFPEGIRELEDMEELAQNGRPDLLLKMARYHEQRRQCTADFVSLLQ